MRLTFLVTAISAFLVSIPAYAGTMTLVDGHGTWQSTRCAPPPAPESLSRNPEAAANDLNSQVGARNQYVASVQAYMNCVSQEAQSDASASSNVIMQAAQRMIQDAQARGTAATALPQRY